MMSLSADLSRVLRLMLAKERAGAMLAQLCGQRLWPPGSSLWGKAKHDSFIFPGIPVAHATGKHLEHCP